MNNFKSYNALVVLGPTASGKTRLAVQLAGKYGGEIISADSRMVFKHMDIGTGKDLKEYFYLGKPIACHLINLVEPNESYSVFQFQEDFEKVYSDLQKRNVLPVICGGSGLYLEAVLRNFTFTHIPSNPMRRAKLEQMNEGELQKLYHSLPNNPYSATADVLTQKRLIRAIEIMEFLIANPHFQMPERTQINPLVIGLNPELTIRRKRIQLRLEQRLSEGLIEEVIELHKNGISYERLSFFGLEYKWVASFLQGIISKTEMEDKLCVAIQQFAKRQMTYFRKMEKAGIDIHWVQTETEAINFIEKIINQGNEPTSENQAFENFGMDVKIFCIEVWALLKNRKLIETMLRRGGSLPKPDTNRKKLRVIPRQSSHMPNKLKADYKTH